jgi:hypothetical protein
MNVDFYHLLGITLLLESTRLERPPLTSLTLPFEASSVNIFNSIHSPHDTTVVSICVVS